MSDATPAKPGAGFYAISGFFLFFNIIGLYLYYVQKTQTAEQLATLGPEKAAFMAQTPMWAHAAYGTAVTVGVIASVLLLIRSRLAFPAYVVSFAAVLIQDLDSFVLRNALDLWGGGALAIPVIVIVVCVAELWYSKSGAEKYYR